MVRVDGWDKGLGFIRGGGGGTRVARTAKNLVALGAVGSVLIRRGGSGRRRGE